MSATYFRGTSVQAFGGLLPITQFGQQLVHALFSGVALCFEFAELFQFLRHIERTRVILHILDCDPPDGSSPVDNYRAIRAELAGYSQTLAETPEVIALNKVDLLGTGDDARAAVELIRGEMKLGASDVVIPISAATRQNVGAALEACWKALGAVEESFTKPG